MRLLFAAYREWALSVHDRLRGTSDLSLTVAKTPESLISSFEAEHFDAIAVVGWSWRVPISIVESISVVGMHPSALPLYAGGSPLQHQIIDGNTDGVATLFQLAAEIDGGPILDREPFRLEGHLDEILASLADATLIMMLRFIERFPRLDGVPQTKFGPGFRRTRLKPEDSRLSPSNVSTMNCRQLWNLIRCREDPYPNVYLEDETGRLILSRVEFEPRK